MSGLNAFQVLGFGFIEIGPIVVKKPKIESEPKIENSQILFSNYHEKVPLKQVIKKLTTLNMQIPILAKIDTQVTRNEWDIIVQHLTPFVDGFIGTSEQINSFVANNAVCLEHSFYVSISTKDMNNIELNTRKLFIVQKIMQSNVSENFVTSWAMYSSTRNPPAAFHTISETL